MESTGRDKEAAMDYLTKTIPPMDMGAAESLLLEAKQIMDEQGVVFFLRQGTCLGAVRDGAFIPWDDDLDIGSIHGLHGFRRESVEPVAAAFRNHGFHVRISTAGRDTWLGLMKQNIRIDWFCYTVRRESIVHFPGVAIPIRLFKELKEIDFLGEKFLVPNPPEEYLRFKYGPNWMTPKRIGYEKDVVDSVPEGPIPGRAGRLKQFLVTHTLPNRAAKLLNRASRSPGPRSRSSDSGSPGPTTRAVRASTCPPKTCTRSWSGSVASRKCSTRKRWSPARPTCTGRTRRSQPAGYSFCRRCEQARGARSTRSAFRDIARPEWAEWSEPVAARSANAL